jgi:hypothetical protein
MSGLLFGIYRFSLLFLYIFLSAVLLYNRRVKRWFAFSLGFAIVYSIGCFLFFGRAPIASIEIVRHVYLILLLGVALLCAYGLFNEWTGDQFLGAVVLLLAALVVLLIATFGTEPLRELGFPMFSSRSY